MNGFWTTFQFEAIQNEVESKFMLQLKVGKLISSWSEDGGERKFCYRGNLKKLYFDVRSCIHNLYVKPLEFKRISIL